MNLTLGILLFFNISGGEIIVIFLVVLMFFGTKSIPSIARTMGRTIRQVKDLTGEIQDDIKNSTSGIVDDVKKAQQEFTIKEPAHVQKSHKETPHESVSRAGKSTESKPETNV